MNKICLKNGINLIIEPMMNTHSITVGLYVRAGTRYEHQKNGITHLLEHIHFRELDHTSQDELYYNMESIGSTLRASTFYDFIKFSMKIKPTHLKKCIDIFKTILSTYNWTDESLKKEKEVVKNQIDEANFNFSEKAIIKRSLFGDSNMASSIMGSLESVEAIDLHQLISYKTNVFNKNNFVICVTGYTSDSDIQYIENQLCSITVPEGEKNVPSNAIPLLYHRKPNIILNNDEWHYMDVNISFDIDYSIITIDELKILNCILGEGVGSRLQKCVRENLNFTSNIFSETEIYEDFAILHVKFSVKKSLFLECISNVFNTIASLKHNISSADLDISLPFYSENQIFLQDDTEEMNFFIGYNSFVLSNDIEPFSIKNDDTSIVRLMDVAKNVFTPSNTSVIVFGNCNRITKKSIRKIIYTLHE